MNPDVIVQAFDQGERELEPLLEQMGWKSWLGVAELGIVMSSEITDFLRPKLSPAEIKVLELVEARISGNINIGMIEQALVIARDPDTRDLALEGRLRMERGLVNFELNNIDEAREDLAWAETRLKSVAKASRDHDLSLLNKAAFHIAIDEHMMALHVHSEISRHAGHAHETIAISRIQAARIMIGFGHLFDAARNAFNSHTHAIIARQTELAVEAGAIFVEVSADFIDDDAEPFADQVAKSGPRSIGEDAPTLNVHPDDIYGVLTWCINNSSQEYGGVERPDLQTLMILAKKLGKTALFDNLLLNPDLVEDAMLAALCGSVSSGEIAKAWTERVSDIMTLKFD